MSDWDRDKTAPAQGGTVIEVVCHTCHEPYERVRLAGSSGREVLARMKCKCDRDREALYQTEIPQETAST
jgi:hypothetical protein